MPLERVMARTTMPEQAPDIVLPADGLRHTLRRGAWMSAAGLVAAQTVAVLQTLVLARLLSPAEVGQFAAGAVLTVVMMTFAHGALGQALIQREDRIEDAANTVFWVTLGTGLVASLGALAAAPLIGMFFNSPTIGAVAAATSGTILLHALTNVPDALMQRRFQFKRRLIVDPAVAISFAAVSIVLAALDYGVWSLVIGYYASLIVWLGTSWGLARWRPGRGRFSFQLWRGMASFGLPLLFDDIVERFREMAELMIIGNGLNATGLGHYRYGRRIATLPGIAITQVCSYVLFPAFSRMFRDKVRFKNAFLRALSWIWLAAVPAAGLMIALGEPLVVLLLGEPWRGAGVVLAAMAGFGLGQAMNSVSGESMKGAGRPGRIGWMAVVGLVTGVPLLLVLIPFGLLGVGLAVSGASIAVGIAGLALARSVVAVSVAEMAARMVPPVLAALAAIAAIAPLDRYVLRSDQHAIASGLGLIALETVAFLLVYVMALRVVSPVLYQEIKRVAVEVLSRLRGRA